MIEWIEAKKKVFVGIVWVDARCGGHFYVFEVKYMCGVILVFV